MDTIYQKLRASGRWLTSPLLAGPPVLTDQRSGAVAVHPSAFPRVNGRTTLHAHLQGAFETLEPRKNVRGSRPYAPTGSVPSSAPFEELFSGGPEKRIVGDLTKFHTKERSQLEAMREERRRFARDIHDGILQALTGAAMQLEAASRLIDSDPATARLCLQTVCEIIESEQRELRQLISKSETVGNRSTVQISELSAVLENIRDRIGRQWALCVELTIGGHGCVPRALSEDIYGIVQEGLANIARHAHAKSGRVALLLFHNRVSITVGDDGCGFPFRGRFDLPALIARDIGPVSLRERVATRHGALLLISSLSGSTLEISLPFKHVTIA